MEEISDHESTEKDQESPRRKLFPDSPQSKTKRRFFRDLDDSSDEEELEKKCTPLSYEDECQRVYSPNVISDLNTRSFWLIHTLSNRLLYSREVSKKYYGKKLLLLSKSDSIKIKLKNVICEVILDGVKKISELLLNLCDKSNLTNEDIKHLQQQALKEAENQISIAMSQLEEVEEKNEAFSIHQITEIISNTLSQTNFSCFFDKKRYVYKTPAQPNTLAAPDKHAKLRASFESTIVQTALDSIKERIVSPTKTLPKDSPDRHAPLTTIYTQLSNYIWVQHLSPINDGRCSPAPLLRGDSINLTIRYLWDLITHDNQNLSLFSEIWKKVTDLQMNCYWLVDYLNINDERLQNLVCFWMKRIATEKIERYFLTNRPTLGNTHDFTSEGAVNFLANVRLAHRSMRREIKNIKSNAVAKNIFVGKCKKPFHFQWQFLKGSPVFALETQSIHGNTLLRETKVDGVRTYENLYEQILNFRTKLGSDIDDKKIASWIRKLFTGTFQEELDTIPSEYHETVLEHITRITYLLLGCEPTRNPGCLIIHQMAIDLVTQGEKTWHALFMGENSKLPMAATGSIERARALNMYFTRISGTVSPYVFDESIEWSLNLNLQFAELFQSECRLLHEWFVWKKIDPRSNLNHIASEICKSFETWFGKDSFDMSQFILQEQQKSTREKFTSMHK